MLRWYKNHPIRHSGGRHARIAQQLDGKKLELRPCLNDADPAVFARKVDLAIRCDRRSGVASLSSETFLVDLFVGLYLIESHDSGVRDGVEIVAINDRRGHVR